MSCRALSSSCPVRGAECWAPPCGQARPLPGRAEGTLDGGQHGSSSVEAAPEPRRFGLNGISAALHQKIKAEREGRSVSVPLSELLVPLIAYSQQGRPSLALWVPRKEQGIWEGRSR